MSCPRFRSGAVYKEPAWPNAHMGSILSHSFPAGPVEERNARGHGEADVARRGELRRPAGLTAVGPKSGLAHFAWKLSRWVANKAQGNGRFLHSCCLGGVA